MKNLASTCLGSSKIRCEMGFVFYENLRFQQFSFARQNQQCAKFHTKNTEENLTKNRISLWNRKLRLQIPALSSGEGLGLPRSEQFLLLYSLRKCGSCHHRFLLLTNYNFPVKYSFACCLCWGWAGWQGVSVTVTRHHHSSPFEDAARVSYKLTNIHWSHRNGSYDQFKEGWNFIQGNRNDHKCWRSSSGMKFSSSKCKVTRFGPIRSSAMAGDMTW